MNTANEYDVAIIGYGPVGASAANLLGSRGLRVLVVERDQDIYARARAISTDEEIIRIWQRVGLAERLKSDMLSERPVDFVGVNGTSFIHAVPKPNGHGHPPQLFIYQPAVEQVLREGVERFPNVTVRLGQECVRQTQDADGVQLTLLDVENDTVARIRATYVIAADGGSSPSRGQLGISFEGRTYEDRWIVIDTKVHEEWPEVNHLRFHCNPDRPAVDCPTPLGHHRWEFPVLDGDDEAYLTSPEGVRELLAGQGIGVDQVEVLRAVIYSHHVRFAAKWRVGRIFLAGDAAHVMPPWIGQGMASGVRDVANLSWKLAAVIGGELPESILDTYETERQPNVRRITKSAVFVGKIITERRRWVATARDPLMRAVMASPLKDTMTKASWVPYPRYAAGMFATVPARRASKDATGWQIPQPWVLNEKGSRERLDDVLGTGWSVLSLVGGGSATWALAGAKVLTVLPPGSTATTASVVDIDNVLTTWLTQHGATGVVLRPDGFVYGASNGTRTLPTPPLLHLQGSAQKAEVPA